MLLPNYKPGDSGHWRFLPKTAQYQQLHTFIQIQVAVLVVTVETIKMSSKEI